eukprot:TRINITY_DN3027_c0_g1_i6.p1 TRINITY_DN3027_c0_g1~~TRINITY_DN3027_c0_g1_i6.p1  ORF type:complete len:1063 (+),score=315.09 TRINITY_DN3027_c0_g1_i6:92-3280(+)
MSTQNIVSTENERPRNVVKIDSSSESEESSLDDENFGKIEMAVDLVTSKINHLNQNIDGALKGRKMGPPTETLRVKLRNCLSQITSLLSEIESNETSSTPAVDIDKWEEERKRLTERRRELEQRLSFKASSDGKDDDKAKLKDLLQKSHAMEDKAASTPPEDDDDELWQQNLIQTMNKSKAFGRVMAKTSKKHSTSSSSSSKGISQTLKHNSKSSRSGIPDIEMELSKPRPKDTSSSTNSSSSKEKLASMAKDLKPLGTKKLKKKRVKVEGSGSGSGSGATLGTMSGSGSSVSTKDLAADIQKSNLFPSMSDSPTHSRPTVSSLRLKSTSAPKIPSPPSLSMLFNINANTGQVQHHQVKSKSSSSVNEDNNGNPSTNPTDTTIISASAPAQPMKKSKEDQQLQPQPGLTKSSSTKASSSATKSEEVPQLERTKTDGSPATAHAKSEGGKSDKKSDSSAVSVPKFDVSNIDFPSISINKSSKSSKDDKKSGSKAGSTIIATTTTTIITTTTTTTTTTKKTKDNPNLPANKPLPVYIPPLPRSDTDSRSGDDSESEGEDDRESSGESSSEEPPMKFNISDNLLKNLNALKKEESSDSESESEESEDKKSVSSSKTTSTTTTTTKQLQQQEDEFGKLSELANHHSSGYGKSGTTQLLAQLEVIKQKNKAQKEQKAKEELEREKEEEEAAASAAAAEKPDTSKSARMRRYVNGKQGMSNSNSRPLVSPKLIATDDKGNNNFALFMQMSALRKQPDESEESMSERNSQRMMEVSDSESWSEDEDNTMDLISSFSVREDMNKQGLIRGKKGFNLRGQSGSKRYQMEDAHYCSFPFNKTHDQALFCVFDGHAGKDCANNLVKSFPVTFTQVWDELNSKGENKMQLLTQIWFKVYQVVDEGLRDFKYEGSTGTTVFLWRGPDGKRYLQSANVGDSSAYLCRNGEAVVLSQDHKPTHASERKRISSMGIKLEEGQTRLNGLGVSRAFGDHFPKDIQSGIICEPYLSDIYQLGPKDTRIIVASDGVNIQNFDSTIPSLLHNDTTMHSTHHRKAFRTYYVPTRSLTSLPSCGT